MTNLDNHYMSEALKEAKKALAADEVPVGAVIVHKGRIIGRAHNQIKMLKDPTAHAEMIAITQAAAQLQNERLPDTTLYATIEPCPMCAGAMVLGRVKRLVYGADDPKAGAAGSVVEITGNKKLNHRIEVRKGVLAEECGALLKDFFAGKRRAARLGSLSLAFLFMASFSTAAIAGVNKIEFRPVLSQDELAGKRYDTIRIGDAPVYVWRLSYLSDRDIRKIQMFWSANVSSRLLLCVVLNDESRKRLYHYSKKFGRRKLAVFAEDKFINIVPADPPVFLGDRVIVRWPGTEWELRVFIFKVNKQPPGIVELYIEEQGKYNDVAADAWAEAYENISRYIEEKSRQFATEKGLVEESRE